MMFIATETSQDFQIAYLGLPIAGIMDTLTTIGALMIASTAKTQEFAVQLVHQTPRQHRL